VPDLRAFVDAPGWVKMMPNAHSGYYDTMLEMGYAGLAFLLIFIMVTLHAIARAASNLVGDVCYCCYRNRSILAYWRPFPLSATAYRLWSPRLGGPGPLSSVRDTRLAALGDRGGRPEKFCRLGLRPRTCKCASGHTV
jgi:hypothetical protein